MANCPSDILFAVGIDSNINNGSSTYSSTSVDIHGSLNEKFSNIRFIAYGIVLSVVVCFGVIGNIINLVVFTRPKMKCVTNVYLFWLAVADLMALLISIIASLRNNGIYSTTFASAFFYSHVETPLMKAFKCWDIYIVIALSIERYFGVCLHSKFQEIHKVKWANRLIAAAFIAAFIVYIPLCFRKQTVAIPSSHGIEYASCYNPKVVSHPLFKAYTVLKEIMVRFVPSIILAFLNSRILMDFRKAIIKRNEMFNMASASRDNLYDENDEKIKKSEKRVIILLTGIVLIFFITNTPAAISRIMHVFVDTRKLSYQVLKAVANVLDAVNCAIHFYFYLTCNPEFRNTCLGSIWFPKSRESNLESSSLKTSYETFKTYFN